MSTAVAALRAGVVAMLDARGKHELAELVSRVDLELSGPDQRWRVNERDVSAQTFACLAAPEDYVRLRYGAGELEALRETLAAAVNSPETQLAELLLVVRLPTLAQPWRRLYREAPRRVESDAPPADAVRMTAAALLTAQRRADLADMVERAELDQAELPSSGTLLLKYVLLLQPEDLAQLQRDGLAADAVSQAITDAGTRATRTVATVELRCALISEV